MSRHRMLVCFAHPDDEAFPVGGTLASYTARGVDVRLVCATSGEEGEIRQPSSATRDTLPQVRREELKASCRALGLQEPVLLYHRDSGMQGDEANNHPQAFIRVPAEQVVEPLVAEMRGFRPHVVLTFGADGLYGHPDHCAMSEHATAAFHLAGDPQAFPHQLADRMQPYSPLRLFYSARPRGFRMAQATRFREAGLDVPMPSIERRNDGVPPEELHLDMDVSAYMEQKKASLRSHFTQMQVDSPYWRVSHEVLAETLGREHFMRGYPPVEPGATVPADFFSGIEATD